MIEATALGRPMRVLVVEDEPMIAFVIEDVIDTLGAEMLGPIAQLEDALLAARSEKFDCAVLDVNICGEKVFPVADILLERRIPFLLATGYDSTSLPGHLAGVRRITKPYTITELEDGLKRLGAELR